MTSPKQRRIAALSAGGYDLSGRHESWDILAHFVRYDPETGRILETGRMASAAIDRMKAVPGRFYLRGEGSLGDHYVDVSSAPRTLKRKTACPATLVGTVFKGLPVPCLITVRDETGDDTVIQCDDPELSLSFDYTGSYALTVSSDKHFDGLFTIEV